MLRLLLLLAFLGCCCQALPKGFHDEAFLDDSIVDFKDPMDFEFYVEADGSTKVILVDRLGFLYWIDNPEESPEKQLILDISDRVCGDGSRGLMSVVLHPNFRQNRWLYIFYTRITDGECALDRATGPVNRISRFVVSTHDNTVDTTTELVLLETSRTAYHYHNGGDMKFGKDGFLYISTGDGGHRPVCQDPADVMGSFLRLTEDGGIPPEGNAYKGKKVVRCNVTGRPIEEEEGAQCAEVWAKGLRNPFRFALDPAAEETLFYINDVGGGTWEEINEAGTNYRGVNYGWEEREGPCQKNSETKCELTDYADPVYWYIHDGIGGSAGGGSIVGGDFVPEGLWPSEYDGKFIFADYVYGELYMLHPSGACRTDCEVPIPGFTNTTIHQYPKLVDVKFGPYYDSQALYYLSRDGDLKGIRRIIYTGTEGNRPPVPILKTSTPYAEVGDEVTFDASRSFDPDGDKMKFKFQFGKEKALPWQKEPVATFKFNEPGKHRVRLRVKDNQGSRDITRTYVVVGDLPNAEIVSPTPDTVFAVGDQLLLSAKATTPDGSPLPDSSISWEVRKHHNVHFHPFFDGVGNNVWTPHAPEPEDLYASTDSYLEVILRVEGIDGLVREVRQDIYPKIVEVKFDTSPSGLTLSIFDFDVITPATVFCWENQHLEVEAVGNPKHTFLDWSDGGSQSHLIHISSEASSDHSYTVSYQGEC